MECPVAWRHLLTRTIAAVPNDDRPFRMPRGAAPALAVMALGLAALPPALAQPQPQAPVTQPDAYILGPGDQLQVDLLDPRLKELSGATQVLNDGTAVFPLLGSVTVSGYTIDQARGLLTRLYGRQVVRPDLTLRLQAPRPQLISVIGEVSNPGLYTLTPTENSGTANGGGQISGVPTLITAIQKAGGLTQLADLRNVRLSRRLIGAPGRLKTTSLDLAALLQRGDQQQNPYLFDGDTIEVGRAEAPTDAEIMELAVANFSPSSIRVNVVGEVKAPGEKQLRANTPLVQAILAAGGPVNFRARTGSVDLVRINRNGTATRQAFAVNYGQGVSSTANPPLRDGDTIIVNRSFYAQMVDGFTAVTAPLSSLVNGTAIYNVIRTISTP